MIIPSLESLKSTCKSMIPDFAKEENKEIVDILVTAACQVLIDELTKFESLNLFDPTSKEFRRAWLEQFANIYGTYSSTIYGDTEEDNLNLRIFPWLSARGTRRSIVELGVGLGARVQGVNATATNDDIRIVTNGDVPVGWYLDCSYPDFYPTSNTAYDIKGINGASSDHYMQNIHQYLTVDQTYPNISTPLSASQLGDPITDALDMRYAFLYPVDLTSMTFLLYKGLGAYDNSAINFWKEKNDTIGKEFIEENFLSDFSANIFLANDQFVSMSGKTNWDLFTPPGTTK